MSLEDFIDDVDRGSLAPYDGYVSHVLINGHTTNIWITDRSFTWTLSHESFVVPLKDLPKIPGYIQVIWVNR